MSDDDNVVKFGAIEGGKPKEDVLPQHQYEITDFDGTIHQAYGFLVFTSQHVAIMKQTEDGALPVVVLPLEFCKYAKLSEQQDLPF